MNPTRCLLVLLAAAALASTALAADPLREARKPATQPAGPKRITVAILDFDASSSGSPEMGKQIGELVTGLLSGESGFTLVDRSTLARTLQEHELTLSGLVSADQAVKVGKLVGAKILVTGKAFAMDKTLFVTAKIIGVETSLVEGLVVKAKLGADTGELVADLATKLSGRLRDAGPRLLAGEEAADPLPGLKARLQNRKLPKIALQIAEQHISAVRVIDPPVETELKMMLTQCGLEVVGSKAAADVVVKGEALSEFAARVGALCSCSARVELTLLDAKDKVLFADRATTRAADLSEHVAAKTALQRAGRELGLRLLEHLVATCPAAGAKDGK